MKSWPINILIVLSVGVAIFFFTIKYDAPTDADMIRTGLNGVEKYLPVGSHIVFRSDIPGMDAYPVYVSYFLAPVKMMPPDPQKNDTTLLVLPASVTDSATLALLRRSSVIWQNKDERYQYILIHHS